MITIDEVEEMRKNLRELRSNLIAIIDVLLPCDTSIALLDFIETYIQENQIDRDSHDDFYQLVRAEISNGIRNAAAAKYFYPTWGIPLTDKTLGWIVEESQVFKSRGETLITTASALLEGLRKRSRYPLEGYDEKGRKHLIGVVSRSFNKKLDGMPTIVRVEFDNESNHNYNDLLDAVKEYIRIVSIFGSEIGVIND